MSSSRLSGADAERAWGSARHWNQDLGHRHVPEQLLEQGGELHEAHGQPEARVGDLGEDQQPRCLGAHHQQVDAVLGDDVGEVAERPERGHARFRAGGVAGVGHATDQHELVRPARCERAREAGRRGRRADERGALRARRGRPEHAAPWLGQERRGRDDRQEILRVELR